MEESSAQIESHLRHTRDELSANLGELKHRVAAATHWRTYYERSPGAFLATAVGGGVLLALVTRRGPGRLPPRPTAAVRRTARGAGALDASLAVIKGALIGLAVDRAKTMLLESPRRSERLPEAGQPPSAEPMRTEKDGSTVIG